MRPVFGEELSEAPEHPRYFLRLNGIKGDKKLFNERLRAHGLRRMNISFSRCICTCCIFAV